MSNRVNEEKLHFHEEGCVFFYEIVKFLSIYQNRKENLFGKKYIERDVGQMTKMYWKKNYQGFLQKNRNKDENQGYICIFDPNCFNVDQYNLVQRLVVPPSFHPSKNVYI